MKKSMLTIISLLMFLVFAGCGKTKLNLEDYVTIEFSGVDGRGNANIDFSWGEFEEDYMKKSKGKLDETFALEMLMWDCIHYNLDRYSGLSNGDVVTLTIETDPMVKKQYKVDLGKNVKKKIKVQNLTQPVCLDAFADDIFDKENGIEISYNGISPNASVTVVNKLATTDPRSNLDYYIEDADQHNVKEGDKITVHAEVPAYYEEEMGYYLTEDTKQITCTGLKRYMTSLDELPEEIKNKMDSYAKDELKKYIAENWDEEASMKKMELLGCYFLHSPQSDAYGIKNNKIDFVYRIDVENEESSFSYYYYTEYQDIIILQDGEISVDLSAYVVPEGGGSFWGIYGNCFKVGSYYYIGYENLDDLYYEMVTKNVTDYDYQYESTVE